MLRAMFTAISSLNLHQNYLDVISDNLANANTTAFKASRVVFQDQFAQMMSPGSSPSDTAGGINPTQIGLGVQVGYISPIFTQGMLQSTGRNTDLAISGDGFFIYDQGVDRRYSREGSLEIDANGYLVNNATGLRIQGWPLQPGNPGPVDTNQPIGPISIELDSTLARATSNVNIAGNLAADTTTGAAGAVDASFTVYDSMGTAHQIGLQFSRSTDPATPRAWTWTVTSPAYASGTGSLTFDENGQVTGAATGNINITGQNGADDQTVANGNPVVLDLSKLTMLAGDTNVSSTNQDGLAPGSVSDVYATPNTGEVYLVYSNGLKQLIGQLALARFTNPSGMMRAGHNLFRAGLNSGDPNIGTAGTGGRGTIAAGYLEASNVDMAQEFTNMILAQRGFQASSRVITTSDEILQELVNLKR